MMMNDIMTRGVFQ